MVESVYSAVRTDLSLGNIYPSQIQNKILNPTQRRRKRGKDKRVARQNDSR